MYIKTPFKIDKIKYYSIIYGTPKPSVSQKLKLWLFNFSFQCVAVFRLGNLARKINNKNKIIGIIPFIIYYFLNIFVKLIHHVDIDKNADIGPGFIMMHHYSIIIGPIKIGKNCTIHHNVTFGQRVANQDRGVPEIGDNVWVGPNVVITGSIKIGNGATISAGCVVSKDIPAQSLVAGNPGRVIMNEYDNSRILNFTV